LFATAQRGTQAATTAADNSHLAHVESRQQPGRGRIIAISARALEQGDGTLLIDPATQVAVRNCQVI
jgi:hypothetical protein